jgi:hypothetical protein
MGRKLDGCQDRGASEDTGERACYSWADVRDAIVIIPESHGAIQIMPRLPGRSYIRNVRGAMPWRSQRKGVAQAAEDDKMRAARRGRGPVQALLPQPGEEAPIEPRDSY